MMYANKFTAAIKVAGKVLREQNDTVRIPFGSEYSILLKNLNTVRAVVDVYIDGDNIVPGGLVIGAGEQIDLERSIKNNNYSTGNKFKFIERTSAIEDHRGVGLEDGIIRVEFKFEVVNPYSNIQPRVSLSSMDIGTYSSGFYGGITTNCGGQAKGIVDSTPWIKASGSAHMDSTFSTTTTSVSLNSMSVAPTSVLRSTTPANEAGITVAGGKSDQQFRTASWFPTEAQSQSLVFKLVGKTKDNEPVQEAVTVKAKPKCTTCGRVNKATAKFCNQCGTSLEIFA
jgi:zinc-ribbon domain